MPPRRGRHCRGRGQGPGVHDNIAERAAINPRLIAYFGAHRPASILLEVSALVDPRLTVEIECQAVIGA